MVLYLYKCLSPTRLHTPHLPPSPHTSTYRVLYSSTVHTHTVQRQLFLDACNPSLCFGPRILAHSNAYVLYMRQSARHILIALSSIFHHCLLHVLATNISTPASFHCCTGRVPRDSTKEPGWKLII